MLHKLYSVFYKMSFISYFLLRITHFHQPNSEIKIPTLRLKVKCEWHGTQTCGVWQNTVVNVTAGGTFNCPRALNGFKNVYIYIISHDCKNQF